MITFRELAHIVVYGCGGMGGEGGMITLLTHVGATNRNASKSNTKYHVLQNQLL